MDFDTALDSSCRAKVHAGPGMVKQNNPNAPADKEVKFVLDFDLYMAGEIQPMLAAGALETLHGHAASSFRGPSPTSSAGPWSRTESFAVN